MKKALIFAFSLILFIGICILIYIVSEDRTPATQNPSSQVSLVAVSQEDVPFILTFPGTIEPVHSVIIRPQITGIIQSIDVPLGSTVKKGQLLFTLDPASFDATLKKAQATLQRDKTSLIELIADAARLKPLSKKNYVSKQAYQQALSQVSMQEALVKADKADVSSARINLSYTQIRSPIDGLSGNISLKVGDLADTSITLLTINQMDKVYANFSVPAATFRQIELHRNNSMPVEVLDETGKTVLAQGALVFIDNQFNADTATILVKALVDNTAHQLWTNLLVRIHLQITVDKNVMTLPVDAIHVDDKGYFVYEVDTHNIVQLHYVKVDRQADKKMLITSGLKVGEKVILTAPPSLDVGDSVSVK